MLSGTSLRGKDNENGIVGPTKHDGDVSLLELLGCVCSRKVQAEFGPCRMPFPGIVPSDEALRDYTFGFALAQVDKARPASRSNLAEQSLQRLNTIKLVLV